MSFTNLFTSTQPCGHYVWIFSTVLVVILFTVDLFSCERHWTWKFQFVLFWVMTLHCLHS